MKIYHPLAQINTEVEGVLSNLPITFFQNTLYYFISLLYIYFFQRIKLEHFIIILLIENNCIKKIRQKKQMRVLLMNKSENRNRSRGKIGNNSVQDFGFYISISGDTQTMMMRRRTPQFSLLPTLKKNGGAESVRISLSRLANRYTELHLFR